MMNCAPDIAESSPLIAVRARPSPPGSISAHPRGFSVYPSQLVRCSASQPREAQPFTRSAFQPPKSFGVVSASLADFFFHLGHLSAFQLSAFQLSAFLFLRLLGAGEAFRLFPASCAFLSVISAFAVSHKNSTLARLARCSNRAKPRLASASA